MLKRVLLTAMVLTVSLANAQQKSKTLVVAVIDTGIDAQAFNRHVLCKTGHKDFTGTGIQDRHGHGTHISGLIDQYAKSIFLGKDKNYKEIKKELIRLGALK